ncbi:hypothetical protein BOO35_02710 [Vibrio navarrensis]|uniref:hypothetical protein n=1 Tax=Vibrio navarrensis TaxID=29495 RepID=UPI0018675038|nr:hypothetical protein [Vibrio navarrensis]MBE3664063.1 hypothetical protein [Vibrio navarrensis]MBE4580064.1 hypothetical protein [Vibrio navarrensis]
MDLLKEEFLDQLRAEIDEKTGKVIIEAAEFTPQQILQDMSFVPTQEHRNKRNIWGFDSFPRSRVGMHTELTNG